MLKDVKAFQTFRWISMAMLMLLALATRPVQAQNYLYFSDAGANTISRLNLSSSAVELVVSGCNVPRFITTDGTCLYWANRGDGTIGKLTLSTIGGTPDTNQAFITLASGASKALTGIAVDGTYLYWTERDGQCIGRVEKADGTTGFNETWINSPGTYTADPTGIAVDATNVYWTSLTDQHVNWVPLASPGAVPSRVTASANSTLFGIGVNSTNSNVYWADSQIALANSNGLIGRSPISTPADHTMYTLGGVGPNGYVSPCGLVVANYLYFLDWNLEGIYQANLDGTGSPSLLKTLAGTTNLWGLTFTGTPALVVSLSSFTATPAGNQVTLAWTTGSEMDNAGFHIWRSTSPAGGFVKLTTALIPTKATFPSGASYTWIDSSATAGQTWYYKLEDIDTRNVSTMHGPISASSGPSAIQSFQAVPATIFKGGTAVLSWAADAGTALSLSGIGPVTGSSLKVHPTGSTSYMLTDGKGGLNLTTVTVRGFTKDDMPGLSKAWGSTTGQAAFDPAYDVNGDGKVDDSDVALLLNH